MSGKAIVEKAKTFLGTPYVRGGTTPDGFDCSGFVCYVLKLFNIKASNSPDALLKGGKAGTGAAGDVVCWKGHVGFCDGTGQVVHAYGSNPGSVRINNIADCSRWDNRPVLGYRRYY